MTMDGYSPAAPDEPVSAGEPLERPGPHAVIIGAGFGGLAAAIRLGHMGYRVTIVERLDQAGGRASVFRQDGFVFDAGPTIITAPFLLEELWSLCGKSMRDDIELRPMRPFYRILFADGEHLDCSDDPEAMRSELMRVAPEDVEGYERFLRRSEEIYRVGFEELGHVPFSSLADMVRILPQLVKLGGLKTVYQMACRYVRSNRMRIALSFHPLLVGGNPLTTTSVYALIHHLERKFGVHFVMGGTGALVAGLVRLIRGQGGQLRFGAEVRRIVTEDRRATGVELANGERIDADVVVSNADAAWTYRELLADVPRRRWSDSKLRRSRYSMSLFVWYFGTNRRFEDVPHHTIIMGPRYRGLLRDIFQTRRLADDFSLYLHRPTATDPSLAPEGCDTFYVLSPVPHLLGDADWEKTAEAYRQRIAAALESRIMPGLTDSIVSSRIMTPNDFAERYLSVHGAAFGLEPVLTQSAWFRPHNRSEDIENLFLVGAGTHPGAGVPGVISSARVLDRVVPSVSAR